ncbi:MAG: beta-galactosidase/beta-glucuronidase [Paraglaciecola psychrophila]|jgi:beta-galactosidase/beta-glucuronidase
MSAQPRPEYPRPILQRERWLNLNGRWRFAPDPQDSGLSERWYLSGDFSGAIIVPFPIESEASGQHNLKPAAVNWYSRDFVLPGDWNEQLLLHIGASDHWTRVFVNGQQVGQHRGGFDPIDIDISHALQAGDNTVVIRVEDSLSWTQPRGKQAGTTKWPIDYDTVSGIWQSVWLEPVPKVHIDAIHSDFDLATSTLRCWVESNRQNNYRLEVELLVAGQPFCHSENLFADRAEAKVVLDVAGVSLWSPQSPALHPLVLRLYNSDDVMVDSAESYVGLRQVSCNGNAISLNGETIYLRGVLDQGYFEQGWYTAIDDATIARDVELTLALGFNCARKHQKIEDPRYLYWADRLGLLVWEEMPSGRVFSNELVRTLSQQWTAVLRRDRQHPCIIAWVPFNESWGIWNQVDRPEQRAFVDGIVNLTKAQDQSRLVVGNDGWEYSSGDLWTLHLYEGESTSIEQRLRELMIDPSAPINKSDSAVGQKVGALAGADVTGLPILLTECGGIGYTSGLLAGDEFAYGDLPESPAQLRERFLQVAKTIDSARQISGFVWTQLTDVQQEINGVLYFDRSPKFAIEEIREIMLTIGASFKADL